MKAAELRYRLQQAGWKITEVCEGMDLRQGVETWISPKEDGCRVLLTLTEDSPNWVLLSYQEMDPEALDRAAFDDEPEVDGTRFESTTREFYFEKEEGGADWEGFRPIEVALRNLGVMKS